MQGYQVNQDDPREMPSFLMKQIAHELIRRGEARLRPLGFGFSTLPVLVALKNGDATTQADLARLLKVEQPSMAQTLARMERDNLITRRADPRHARSQIVQLTDRALGGLPQARDLLAEDNKHSLAGFSDEEAATFLALLKRVDANLREGLQQNKARMPSDN